MLRGHVDTRWKFAARHRYRPIQISLSFLPFMERGDTASAPFAFIRDNRAGDKSPRNAAATPYMMLRSPLRNRSVQHVPVPRMQIR